MAKPPRERLTLIRLFEELRAWDIRVAIASSAAMPGKGRVNIGMARWTAREDLKRAKSAGLSRLLPADTTNSALKAAALYANRHSSAAIGAFIEARDLF